MRRILLALALAPAPALACGPDTDCAVDGGTYRIAAPVGATGAILFAHGYRNSAAGTMGNAALRTMADDLGTALVALQSAGDDWSLPGSPGEGRVPPRDEPAYVLRVRDAVAAELEIAPSRMVLAGFSAGGMLTWTMACADPDAFAGFAAFSGTFWEPGVPDRCAGPAAIRHHHGTADAVVPMAGRAIGATRQGDVAAVLGAYRTQFAMAPVAAPAVAGLACDAWGGGGARLALCTHPGGHTFRADWLAAFWRDAAGP